MAQAEYHHLDQPHIDAQTPQAMRLPDDCPNPEGGAIGLVIDVHKDKTLINLRAEDRLKARFARAFGTELPKKPNQMNGVGGRRAIWLGPDETLLILDQKHETEAVFALRQAAGSSHHAITIISDALCIIQLSGPKIRTILAKGCAIDLHDTAFGPLQTAQSYLAHAGVTLACEADGQSILLICRTSFSDYVISWLKDAALEYGYRFKTPSLTGSSDQAF